ncbi:MAG: hypothetical protein GWP08_10305 [Nitrospiraceae bacterium]|nr:hypothetical protein [Nitrospiraceae bacterium]
MNSQRNKTILVIGLVVVLAGVLIFQFAHKPARSPAAASKKTQATGQVTTGESVKVAQLRETDVDIRAMQASIKEVDFDYDRERQARDPLTPLVGALARRTDDQAVPDETVPPAILGEVLSKTVSGIVWDARRPVAVVDNEVVYPGYQYPDGTSVAAIEPGKVVFKVGDSLIQVELEEL